MSDHTEAPKPNSKGRMKKPPKNTVTSQAAQGVKPSSMLREQPRKTIAELNPADAKAMKPKAKPLELGEELVNYISEYHRRGKLEPSWPDIAASLQRAQTLIRFGWSDFSKGIKG